MQCGHYSERVRRDGLGGLADLLAKHPAELRRHAGPLVERLAERITDPSAGVHYWLMSICLKVSHCIECHVGKIRVMVQMSKLSISMFTT